MTERTVCTAPSAMSRPNTLIRRPVAIEQTIAPGCPLISVGRERDAELARPGRRCPTRSRPTRSRPTIGRGQEGAVAAAVAVHHDVRGEQRRPGRPCRRRRPRSKNRAASSSRLPREASKRGRFSVDVAPRPHGQLAAVVLALADDPARPRRSRSRRRRAAGRRPARPASAAPAAAGTPSTASRPARHGRPGRPLVGQQRLGQPLADVAARGGPAPSAGGRCTAGWSRPTGRPSASRSPLALAERRAGSAGTPPARCPRPR